jgi:GT2 family glycosyltransferase/glycosyltransferase involved in cell wall biosynthesis
VGHGHFDGHLYVHDGFATGWTTERVEGFSPPRIDIVGANGEILASGESRRDAADGDPNFAPARFRIGLANLFGQANLDLTAQANGAVFAHATGDLRLVGTLDVITPTRCAGWLYSPDSASVRFAIEIYRDGKLAAVAQCNLPREDVKAAHPQSNPFGFDVSLPDRDVSSLEPCELSFRFPGSAREQLGGPYIASHRAGTIAAARRAAQSAHAVPGSLGSAERSFMQRALSDYIATVRRGKPWCVTPKFAAEPAASERRLTVIVPVYKDVLMTEECVRSVLEHRNPSTDHVLLINDASPERGMAEMLARFAREPNFQILTNATNLGFVKTVNRGLSAVAMGDVLLLNSDAEVYAGGFDELVHVAHASPEIGTATALSNNATIFSYPHASLRVGELGDISWRKLAALALRRNAGRAIDVPTAHGFCMLIKRQVLQRVGQFDESFGRGYGEENDFCARAADLGFRNVAAAAVFVRHHESLSFAEDKQELLTRNLAVIASRFPEYMPTVMEFERQDAMRSARWELDAARLHAASEDGARFVLVITNGLGGGTAESIEDVGEAIGLAKEQKLLLECRADGFMELTAGEPSIRATFSPAEFGDLFHVLTAASPTLVMIHQLLGYDAAFVRGLPKWIAPYRSVFYLHDYYALCPRVTMIDATGAFCNKPPADVCDRCVDFGGRHEASRLTLAHTEEHYALMKALLWRVTHVVAPSANAAGYLNKAYPKLKVEIIPHPEIDRQFAVAARDGSDDEILLLGAIGPHKGSQKLLEIARLARLRHPELRFRVVGYTDIDSALLSLGNVSISGAYTSGQLPDLLAQCRGRLALFLHLWPETYSYTLSEAVSHGFIPLVPDIGAPAERVRETGFGVVFPFPIEAEEVLSVIAGIAAGKRPTHREGASPSSYRPLNASIESLRAALGITGAAPHDAPAV